MSSIMIIEPDRLLSEAYALSLKLHGHIVWECMGAQEAVNLIDKHFPDIIILELQLINHSGIEFLYEFRSYSEWQKIPIIVHTFIPPTLFMKTNLQMKNLGVVQYLYKPSTKLTDLVSEVKRAVA